MDLILLGLMYFVYRVVRMDYQKSESFQANIVELKRLKVKQLELEVERMRLENIDDDTKDKE